MLDRKLCLSYNKNMEILKKHKKIIILIFLVAGIFLWCKGCTDKAHFTPNWEKKDISGVLAKEKLTAADYKFLSAQTGLSKTAIDDFLSSGKPDEITAFQNQYFKRCEYDTESVFFPVVMTEVRRKPTKIASVKKGDVLVSLTTYTLGFRHGHAGIVLDGETGKTLESTELGEVSSIGNLQSWKYYPTFAILRCKDEELAAKAADYAEKNLIGVSYNPFAGVFGKDKSGEKPVSSTQCAHIVWQAYKAVGADIDGNGGIFVFPGDFLKSDLFEIVQIYGIAP